MVTKAETKCRTAIWLLGLRTNSRKNRTEALAEETRDASECQHGRGGTVGGSFVVPPCCPLASEFSEP